MSKDTINNIQCPDCDSEAVYRDGRARTGKQRYLCLMCGFQFTISHRVHVGERPSCEICGSGMHVYRKEQGLVRFRCSRYPVCKTYKKILMAEFGNEKKDPMD